jgi:4-alpha-glucanotransferase
MKLTFKIEYRTSFGETIGVISESDKTAVMLHTYDGVNWEGGIEIPDSKTGNIYVYRYGVYRDGVCIRMEYGTNAHMLCLGDGDKHECIVNDFWRDIPAESYLYSSAFSGKYDATEDIKSDIGNGNVILRALCPLLKHKNRILAVTGNCDALGNWGESVVPLTEIKPNIWTVFLKSSDLSFPVSYKFVACDKDSLKIEEWENSDNRTLYYGADTTELYATSEQEIHFSSSTVKVAGTAIPVFSLRSENSFGVGDFGDLKKLVDWAVMTHQQAIQILPINDTTINNTWTDSYPYNSISIYAFHPMYIDVSKLGKMNDAKKADIFEAKRKELNSLAQVDYEAVNNTKREYLKVMYEQEGKRVISSASFRRFFEANKHWLLPYSVFSYLRDKYGTPDFSQWKECSVYNADEVEDKFNNDNVCRRESSFYLYIQYNLHIQLLDVGDYARKKGIILKGDIPIGISRNSVEAWIEPYYFNMNGQAGAPPDAFSVNGQNWGFPTYNWDFMAKDGYKWWRQRFTKMAEYFTAYRIDHILGFFRIWEIPSHSVHGLLGQFVPAMPMSVGEIESYGLKFQKEFMTYPFINEELIRMKFGDKAEMVKNTFLEHSHYDVYSMRPEFDTQRKVEKYFADKKGAADTEVRDALYELISDVLFVVDRTNPDMYHPRISVQSDYIFKRLSQDEQEAFNRLYNDYYYRRHNEFWYHEAMKKLPILTQATSMLVCGEDLGMVPDCVPWVMDNLQILSLEIQRMSKNPQYEFGHLLEYPYRSVCTISTHDMSTLRGWWEEDRSVTQRYYNNMLRHFGEAPEKASEELCDEIVRQHLACPSMLCILSFQDWLSVDKRLRNKDAAAERINIPANPRHYWRWRMHVTIEELMSNARFNDKMRHLIDTSGRY